MLHDKFKIMVSLMVDISDHIAIFISNKHFVFWFKGTTLSNVINVIFRQSKTSYIRLFNILTRSHTSHLLYSQFVISTCAHIIRLHKISNLTCIYGYNTSVFLIAVTSHSHSINFTRFWPAVTQLRLQSVLFP